MQRLNTLWYDRIGGLRSSTSPRALFALGEVGVWFDPSDLTTLFQDSAGTIPVTAAGQPVGLMLDKSKGLALGPELVANGDFSSGTTGWTGTNSAIPLSVAGGMLVVTEDGSDAASARAFQIVTTVVGRIYRISVEVLAAVGKGQLAVNPANPNISGAILALAPLGTGAVRTVTAIFVATSTTSYIILDSATGAAGTVSFDNVSVKEIAGNHATQATSASRPTYQVDGTGRPFLSFDGVDDWMTTGALDFTATEDMTVFAGVRKLSNVARGMVAEFAAASASAFQLNAPIDTGGGFSFASRGNGVAGAAVAASAPYVAPLTNILTGVGKVSTDTSILRVNGAQAGSSAADQGTGNYGSAPLFIGRRDGGTLHFNGNLYSLIIRGAQSTAAQIAATEAWVNSRTGAY